MYYTKYCSNCGNSIMIGTNLEICSNCGGNNFYSKNLMDGECQECKLSENGVGIHTKCDSHRDYDICNIKYLFPSRKYKVIVKETNKVTEVQLIVGKKWEKGINTGELINIYIDTNINYPDKPNKVKYYYEDDVIFISLCSICCNNKIYLNHKVCSECSTTGKEY